MSIDFKALAAKAKETGADHTKVQTGGGSGDYTPPAEGMVRLRFIGYVEMGKHESEFKGVKKQSARVRLYFEASGPKHQPKDIEGKLYPHIIVVEESLSFNDKANWPKLFAKLNYAKSATHPVELLGGAYLANIRHKKWARAGEDKNKPETWTGVDVTLRGEDGAYTLRGPTLIQIDDETGEEYTKQVPVAEALTPLKAFLWENPDMDQWQSLFIEGEYPERKDKDGNVVKAASSKNVIQAKIMQAVNYKGSPLNHLLAANGKELDLGNVQDPDQPDDDGPAPAPKDPLAGVSKAPKTSVVDLDDDIPF